jgi:hypothetical protein
MLLNYKQRARPAAAWGVSGEVFGSPCCQGNPGILWKHAVLHALLSAQSQLVFWTSTSLSCHPFWLRVGVACSRRTQGFCCGVVFTRHPLTFLSPRVKMVSQ